MIVKTVALGIATVSLLGACTMMGEANTTAFRHNDVAADATAAGTASVMMNAGGMTETTLTLSGLTPGKAYAAHYHAFGPDSSTDPCASNGPVSVGFPAFTADSMGRATVSVTNESGRIAGDQGAYINVHSADDLAVVPLCAPLKMTKG